MENLALRTADHDERDRLLEVNETLEDAHKLLQPVNDKAPDPYACIRGSIKDLMSDVGTEIKDLTDRIGDELDSARERAA